MYGRTRDERLHQVDERLHQVIEQVAAVVQGEMECASSVHSVLKAENTKAISACGRSAYGSVLSVEAAGIEPASESLQLQSLHMLFQGKNSHPPNLPGRARRMLAWFKFRLLLLQAWEDGDYPTS